MKAPQIPHGEVAEPILAQNGSAEGALGMAAPRSLSAAEIAASVQRVQTNIGQVLLGKPEIIRQSLIALLAEGHLLIEDVPGVGKTLLAKALARSLDCSFFRIQFTPDLLPSDVLGTSLFHQPTGEFVFQPGPIFAQIVLADEINRATPRTQSALLEAMSERQVSIDGRTRHLGPPFLVLATQNPFEFEGTYPLPESQLDRFLMRLQIGYPDRQAEREILTQHRGGEPVDHLRPVLAAEEVLALQSAVRQVRVEPVLSDYILDLVEATRSHPDVTLGASTRAGLGLYRAAQALSVLNGRDFVVPDDVKRLAPAVLTHRILTRGYRQSSRDESAAAVMREILAQTPVPVLIDAFSHRRPRRRVTNAARFPDDAHPTQRLTLPREGMLWLGAVAALWITGWVKGINLILLLSYLLAALCAFNWWMAWRSLRGLNARRAPIGPVFASSSAPWHVDVACNNPRSLTGCGLRDEGPAHAAEWFVPRLAAGESVRLRGEVRFDRRGLYQAKPLVAFSAYPFGLVRRDVTLDTGAEVMVYPAIGMIHVTRLRRWLMYAARPDERSRRTRRRLAHEVEFHGLRTFRPGDSPRWIHWRTSARRNELMVREFDQGAHFDLLLFVEAHDAGSNSAAVEEAVSLAATIAWNWSKEVGDHIVLAVAGRDCSVVTGAGGLNPLAPALSALAQLHGSPTPDLDKVADQLTTMMLPSGPALLVSSRSRDPAAVERLSRRLRRPVAWLDAGAAPDFYTPPVCGAVPQAT